MKDLIDQTLAGKCFRNPRIAKAKQELLAVIREAQAEIDGPRPPHPHQKIAYQHLLESLSERRGGKIYYPYLGSGLGKGALVELLDGSIKYDFISGIGVHHFGHSHAKLIEANIDAAITDTVMQGHLQQNWDTLHLMNLLAQTAKMDHCFLSSSGAMANENGLKIILQKKSPACRLLAFEHCFMGRTLILSCITDKPQYREGLPMVINVDYVPFFDPEHPEKSTKKAVEVLQEHLHRHPKKYAAMCFELVQGEGGFNLGSHDFFVAIMEILKQENIAIFVDEVQTFGRTLQPFAFQYFGLEKYIDVVTIGKLSQVCATLFRKELVPRPGLLSQTFTASTSAIRSSIVVLEILLTEGYFGPQGKNATIHASFVEHLKLLEKKYPKDIQGPWGIGAMVGFTPFQGKTEQVTQFAQKLFENGVISFTAGPRVNKIRFLIPAIAITDHEINQAMEIVEQTLT